MQTFWSSLESGSPIKFRSMPPINIPIIKYRTIIKANLINDVHLLILYAPLDTGVIAVHVYVQPFVWHGSGAAIFYDSLSDPFYIYPRPKRQRIACHRISVRWVISIRTRISSPCVCRGHKIPGISHISFFCAAKHQQHYQYYL